MTDASACGQGLFREDRMEEMLQDREWGMRRRRKVGGGTGLCCTVRWPPLGGHAWDSRGVPKGSAYQRQEGEDMMGMAVVLALETPWSRTEA